MSWTKDVLIREAFGEIGLNAATFNVNADRLNGALIRLEAMMAQWNAKGIRIGYNLASGADGAELDQDSGLPDSAYETVICSLAMRLAPGLGKVVAAETKATAKAGYDTLLSLAAMPSEQQYQNTMPRGAGNKPWRWSNGSPFMSTPVDPILAGGDGPIEFN
jgi:hypothetical protein